MLKLTPETHFKKTEIGEIPKDWEVRKLGTVADVIRGVSFKQKEAKFEKFKNSIPILRANNISEKGELIWEDLMFINKDKIHPKQFLKEYDIIMVASSGSKRLVGKLFQLKKEPPEKCSFGAFLYCIRPKDNSKYNKRLLGFVLDSPLTKRKFEEVVDGTNINNLRKSDLEDMKLIYPPPSEQSRIATVLSWFDDLIENKKKQNEILEKTAMAIFKNWFIDFEPFKNQKFVDSELGRIPEGWEVELLKNVTKGIFSGRGRYIIESEKGQYPLWGANGILGYINEYDLEGFTILTGRVGTLGKVFLVQNKFAISDNVLAVIPLKEHYTFFIYLWLKTQIDFESLNVGSTQPLITKTALGNEKILLPLDSLLQQFHSSISPLFQKIILNQKQIMLLRKIRDTLLPLLVFGKLRVREV